MAARPESWPAIYRSCHRPCCVAHLPSFLSSSLSKVSFLNLFSQAFHGICAYLSWLAKSSVVSSSSQLSSHRCVLSPWVCVSSSPQSGLYVSNGSFAASKILAAHTLDREVLKLIILLELRRGLCGGGGRLPVCCVVDDGFRGGTSSLHGARHVDGMCEVWCAARRSYQVKSCTTVVVPVRWRCCFTELSMRLQRRRRSRACASSAPMIYKHCLALSLTWVFRLVAV